MNPYFTTRRSIRVYDKTRKVSDEMLEQLLAAAAQAPNTGNMQLYSVIITREPERLEALAPAHFGQPAIRNAAAALTFCLDMHRFAAWCRMSGTEAGLGNLQGFTWGVIDVSVFAQQFCTLAEMEGLGTCYLGTTTYNAPMIADLLALPSGTVPVVTVTVGWPAENPPVQPRLPLEAIVHYETYTPRTDSEEAALYADEESLEANKQFVAENGKDNLAQVFAEVRYPRDQAEHFSRLYKEFLKNAGIPL